MIFETQRLILRPWEEEDAPSLYKYASDPDIGPIAGWLPHQNVEDSRLTIRDVLSEEYTYAVVLKETMEPVGSIGMFYPVHLVNTEIDLNELEVGYWIGKPYWGQGLIPEAVRKLQEYAFETLGCTGLWCGYFEGNEKSRRVQEKCGFQYHHTQENVEVAFVEEIRTEIFTYLSKARWEEMKDARR